MSALQGPAAEKIIRVSGEFCRILVEAIRSSSGLPYSDKDDPDNGWYLVAMMGRPDEEPYVVLSCPFGQMSSVRKQMEDIAKATGAAEKLHGAAPDILSSRELADDASLTLGNAAVAICCENDLILAFSGGENVWENEALLLAVSMYSGWLDPAVVEEYVGRFGNSTFNSLRPWLPRWIS